MHNISIEESKERFPAGIPGGVFIYRPQTDFSHFVMDVVEYIHELGLQRAVILSQKGVPETVVCDATERIAELLESEKRSAEGRQIAIEIFHNLTCAEIRRLKSKWKQSRHNSS